MTVTIKGKFLKHDFKIIRLAGIIGDVHAEDCTLDNVVAFFAEKGVDDIYCTGDLCDGYGSTERVISTIKKSEIHCVRGNHDLWCSMSEMRDLPGAVDIMSLSKTSQAHLGQLPFLTSFVSVCGTVVVCHGILENIMASIAKDDAETDLQYNLPFQEYVNGKYPPIMINGHSHKRMVRGVGEKIIINAGTLLRDHSPSVSLVNFENRVVSFFDIVNNKVDRKSEERIGF